MEPPLLLVLTKSFSMTCFFESLSMINLLLIVIVTMTMMKVMKVTTMMTYSSDKFKRLPLVVPRALNQGAVVQEQGVVGSNLKSSI